MSDIIQAMTSLIQGSPAYYQLFSGLMIGSVYLGGLYDSSY